MRKPVIALLLSCVPLALSACGDGNGADGPADAATVSVELRDFTIRLSRASIPSGKVIFKVRNEGPSVHEFVVFKTDLALDALPTDESGDIAENDTFAPLDEIEDIEDGATPELELDLDEGAYVAVCNLPGHARQGMRAAFTVS